MGNQVTSEHQVALRQKQLRWDAVLDGWLSLAWQEHQEAYWAQWHHCKSIKRWMTKLIKKLFNISWDMWEQRNDALHQSESHNDMILDRKINDQIRECFNQGLQDIPRDTFSFFRQPLEELLAHSWLYKEKWLASVQAAKQQKKHHKFGAYLPEQCGMWHWLGLEESH